MHRILAFVRYDYLTATSYRTSMFFSLGALLISVVPMYFIAEALQPTMAGVIETEGGEYFAFVLVGTIALRWLTVGVSAVPTAIASAVRSGTLESLFTTPVGMPTLLAGMMGYRLLWAALESAVLLAAGLAFGAHVVAAHAVSAVLVLGLIMLAYASVGIAAAASLLLFRTAGPLLTIAVVGSTLLGGIYYPTHVIPSWLEHLSVAVPLTYGLRALRGTLLEGMPLQSVSGDLGILAAFAAVLLAGSFWVLRLALWRARRAGTLAQY